MLLSVGYSACHWCHVMEHESFEDEATARADERALRQHQGRPRGAARRRRGLHGRGRRADRARRLADDGLPDAGRASRSSAARTTRPSRGTGCRRSGRCSSRSREAYRDAARRRREAGRGARRGAAARAQRAVERAADGGAARARRCGAARRSSTRNGAASAARRSSRPPRRSSSCCAAARFDLALGTLDGMRAGGMYDLVGGGFHRYSVDAQWLVPHFEKMLYDNALLVPAYLHAWVLTRREGYREIAERDGRVRAARAAPRRRRLRVGAGRGHGRRRGADVHVDADERGARRPRRAAAAVRARPLHPPRRADREERAALLEVRDRAAAAAA